MSVRTEVLEVLIRAHDEASAKLARVGAEADSMGHKMAGAGRAAAMGLGIAAAGILAVSIDQAAKYQTMLQHIQSNTGMTNKDMQTLSDTIMSMSSKTGAPLEQLAEGFMHIHNFGFSAAESAKILQAAMESALSTGDDVGKVASALGVAMHEFHINADKAIVSMNLLHVAAQEGNSTLGAFVDGTTRAFNVAGGFGVKLQDIAAALSTLTQSGQTARAASDGMASAMFGIVKPTTAATNMLDFLSKKTGVDLVRDFSAAGLKARGLTAIIGDVRLAINKMGGDTALQRQTMLDYATTLEKNNVTGDKFVLAMTKMAKSIHDPTQALISLFPNVRAFREMMLLTGSQADSFTQHMHDMNAVVAGKLDPTTKGFTAEQKTLAAQLKIADANMQIISITIGTQLLPVLTKMLQEMIPVIKAVADWIAKHPQLTTVILAGTVALGALAAILPAVTVLIGLATTAVVALTGPIGAVVIAVGVLATAWSQNWGDIQGKTKAAVDFISGELDRLGGMADAAANKLNSALNLGTTATGVFNASQSVQFVAQWQHSGNAMMEGLAQGMYDKMSVVDKAAVDTAERAIAATKGTLQSKSPSMVFHRIGQDVGQGLANGIASMQEAVGKATSHLGMHAINELGAGGKIYQIWVANAASAMSSAASSAASASGVGSAAAGGAEHYVKGYNVAAHMEKAYTDKHGHFHRAHMVAAHAVAGHYAHNPYGGTAGGAGSVGDSAGAGGGSVVNITVNVQKGAVSVEGADDGMPRGLGNVLAKAAQEFAQAATRTLPGAHAGLAGAA